MSRFYIYGKTKHQVAVNDNCCPHLHVGAVAERYTTEVDSETKTYYTCIDCHEKLTQEITKNFVFCSDCGVVLNPNHATRWKATPTYKEIYLCRECAGGVRHLNRMELLGEQNG